MTYRFICTCVRESTGPRELSQCPTPFQNHFMKAWEAIEKDDYDSLKWSISKMKVVVHGVPTPLDVFLVMQKSGMIYAMTLMAFCGFHGQKKMVQLLLDEGAKIDAGCDGCGAPLFQMIFHCFVQHLKNAELDTTMVRYLIEKGSPLSREICNLEVDGQNVRSGLSWSVLDLPLTMKSMNGFEVAKVLVEVGRIDPITGGTPRGETYNVVPMFQEYCFNGTNNYIRWLCKEHLPDDKRSKFVDRVLMSIIAMKRNEHFTTWIYERRTPSHAILTCRHPETVTLLVQKGKEKDEDLLSEKNSTGKTALHMAAEDGDLESVKILLELEADVTACDNSDVNPFMLALEKGHTEVAKTILEANSDCVASADISVGWALEKNLTAFFKLIGEEDPDILLYDLDGNTIAHLVAAGGNTEVFKIILEILWSEKHMQELIRCTNGEGKTPLELGVEKGCIDILKVVQEQLERPGPPVTWQIALRDKWRSEVVPPLFCHASSCGSLIAVKYFIDNGYQPNMSHGGRSPLLCASEAGHDEVVEYLLQFRTVSSNSQNLTLALLQAAANGHTKCVSLLIQKEEASVLQIDKTGNNCLMLAIKNHHKATALAILSEEKKGLDALKCVHEERTPLRLLIKEMPELAEYVLNRCIARKYSDDPFALLQREVEEMVDSAEPAPAIRMPVQKQTSVTYDFQFLDDFSAASKDIEPLLSDGIPLEETDSPEGTATVYTRQHHLKYKSSNHILKWMIDYKRLQLLRHPLVKDFLFHKFWLVTFPLFLGYLLLYCLFLVFITSFALVSPRPGPGSETCPGGNPNMTNGTNCPGQTGVNRGFLFAAAVLILILVAMLLFIEAVQLFQRRFKYFKEFDNYFQVTLFILTIIFVAPGFVNDCWCAHNWQWQIGALTLCLAWFNLIILLKDIPWTAIPINMFINICTTFLKVLFLPLLLLFAFALPFYMVFVRTSSTSEGTGSVTPELTAFISPAHAIAKTMVQMVGEIDFELIFNEGNLLYNPVTYILFIIFLIVAPVLFINLLIGLAVGDTNEEKEKAEFTKIEVQVDFILERERNSKFLRECGDESAQFRETDETFDTEGCCGKHRFTRFLARLLGMEFKRHLKLVKKIEERNKAIFNDIMGVSDVDAVKATLTQESEKISQLMEEVKALKEKVEGLAKDSYTLTSI